MRSIIRHASAAIAVTCLCATYANAQLTRRELIRIDSARVIADANRYLSEPPVTVTAVRATRSAGGVHDYYSEGDYWWPDPKHPDGKYIRRDGETNPDNFVAHRDALIRLSRIVPALVVAYELTGDTRYARQATAHLNAWFVVHRPSSIVHRPSSSIQLSAPPPTTSSQHHALLAAGRRTARMVRLLPPPQ